MRGRLSSFDVDPLFRSDDGQKQLFQNNPMLVNLDGRIVDTDGRTKSPNQLMNAVSDISGLSGFVKDRLGRPTYLLYPTYNLQPTPTPLWKTGTCRISYDSQGSVTRTSVSLIHLVSTQNLRSIRDWQGSHPV